MAAMVEAERIAEADSCRKVHFGMVLVTLEAIMSEDSASNPTPAHDSCDSFYIYLLSHCDAAAYHRGHEGQYWLTNSPLIDRLFVTKTEEARDRCIRRVTSD